MRRAGLSGGGEQDRVGEDGGGRGRRVGGDYRVLGGNTDPYIANNSIIQIGNSEQCREIISCSCLSLHV